MGPEYLIILDGNNTEKSLVKLKNIQEISKKESSLKVHFSNDFSLDEIIFDYFTFSDFSEKITSLKFENFYRFDGIFLSKLVKHKNFFPKLNEFILNNVRISNFELLLEFFIQDNIKQLQFLTFSNTNITDDFISNLTEKPFTNLLSLNLNSSFKLNFNGFLKLFSSNMVKDLQNLYLQNLGIENDGVLALCFSKTCSNLQELDLSLCSQLTDIAYLNLVMSPNLKNLKKLHLFNTMITSIILKTFDKRTQIKNLSVLRLEENYGIEAEGYGCIGESPFFKNLEVLQISMSKIDDINFQKIFYSEHLKCLKKLIFYDNPKISRACLKEFFQSPLSLSIEELDLSWMDLDDSTLLSLGNSKTLKNLRFLKINNCRNITCEGLCNFLKNGYNLNITKFHLSMNDVNLNFIELLKEKIGKNEITLQELDIRNCKLLTIKEIKEIEGLFKEKNIHLYSDF